MTVEIWSMANKLIHFCNVTQMLQKRKKNEFLQRAANINL